MCPWNEIFVFGQQPWIRTTSGGLELPEQSTVSVHLRNCRIGFFLHIVALSRLIFLNVQNDVLLLTHCVCVWVRLTQRIIRFFFCFTLLLLLLSTTSLSAPHVVVPFGLETRSTQRTWPRNLTNGGLSWRRSRKALGPASRDGRIAMARLARRPHVDRAVWPATSWGKIVLGWFLSFSYYSQTVAKCLPHFVDSFRLNMPIMLFLFYVFSNLFFGSH